VAVNRIIVEVNNKKYEIEIVDYHEDSFRVRIGSKEYIVHIVKNQRDTSTKTLENNIISEPSKSIEQQQYIKELQIPKENIITSEIPGRIVKILVNEGDSIKEGDTIAIIESMKMEIEVKSPRNGIVKKILTKNGSYIDVGEPIVLLS